MMFIPNAAGIREKLAWAMAEEDRTKEPTGQVRGVVEADLMPTIIDYDPVHLIELGMRAVIRDVQEWIDGHDEDPMDGNGLRAYLLGALITAGGVDEPAGRVTHGQG